MLKTEKKCHREIWRYKTLEIAAPEKQLWGGKGEMLIVFTFTLSFFGLG